MGQDTHSSIIALKKVSIILSRANMFLQMLASKRHCTVALMGIFLLSFFMHEIAIFMCVLASNEERRRKTKKKHKKHQSKSDAILWGYEMLEAVWLQ